MDSDVKSLSPENAETKATFRKPSGDVANRNYRRHSPVTASSSSSDESRKRERSSSPVLSKHDPERVPEPHQRRKDADRELDKNSGRRHYDRSGDSFRHSDRYSSRTSYGHSRHDDYSRNEKRSDDGRRHYQSSFHSGRESRGVTYSSRAREETEYGRSRDHLRNADKYLHDRYDSSGHRSRDREKESLSIERHKLKDKESSPDRTGFGRKHTNSISEEKDKERHGRDKDGRDDRRDYYRSSRDYKSDRTLHNDEPRGYRNDSNDLHAQKEKNKREDLEVTGYKDKYNRTPVEENEVKFDFGHENQESLAKKPKLPNSNEGNDGGGDGDEKQSLSSKQEHDIGSKATVGPVHAGSAEAANDLNAAKVAAMKAAELVNKNLVGGGFMSTEQKKKLLWGSKKSTTPEESGHRWDTSLFGDRDRQEKFNKLMSLRLPWYLWPIVGCEGQCECGSQSRRSCSSREAEGTSDGSREAIYCWTSKTRWAYSWIRSLNVCLRPFCIPSTIFYDILLYTHVRVMAIVTMNSCCTGENMPRHGSFHILA